MTTMSELLFGKPPAQPQGLPEDAPRGREAERILQAELLQEWRHYMRSMTEAAARLGGRAVNRVLDARTIAIPADGYVPLNYPVAAGSIEIDNLGTHTMTVVAGQASGTGVPNSGVGVHTIPAGTLRSKNVASRFITIYGTVGDAAAIQVFTAGYAPGVGLGAIDGGAP